MSAPTAPLEADAIDRARLGQRLEALAQSQGMTQAALSRELQIQRTTLSKVFSGQVRKLTHYEAVARRLGTSLDALVSAPTARSPQPGADSTDAPSAAQAWPGPSPSSRSPASNSTPADAPGRALAPIPLTTSRPRALSAGSPERGAVTITVAIQKGGSGKTTTVVNLAALWASQGLRVLIIDLDMQGHSALHLGLEADGQPLMDAIRTRQRAQPQPTPWGVDLLPGGSALRALTPHLLSSINPLVEVRRLARRYSAEYDLILIDTAPSLEVTTCNAIVAADYVLIPVQTETGALDGLAALYEVVEQLGQDHGPLRILGCVPTMHDARTVLHDQLLKTLQSHEHLRPTKTLIKRSVTVTEAFTMRRPLLDYAPKSEAAAAFELLAKELHARLIQDGALPSASLSA